MTNFERLLEFHRVVYGALPQLPTRPSDATLGLRATLLREEYEETVEALATLRAGGPEADLSELAQELVDLLYVTYGTLVDLGVDADAVFAEVHRANMSKLEGPKRADGKQLKPEGWQPADVRGVLDKQGRAPNA